MNHDIGLLCQATSETRGPKWTWYVFGRQAYNGSDQTLIEVTVYWEQPWWRRLLTRILLGSEWVRIKQ